MKMSKLFGIVAMLAVVVLVPTGCATRPKINWAERVGTYTYDQAVGEFGPPGKLATLSDGSKVAEWMTQRGYASVDYVPYYVHHHRYWSGYYATPVVSRQPDVFLRLSFDPAGRLSAWRKVVQ